MRFLVDEMLFDVAKYLRFMGYDALVLPSGSPDSDLLEDAKEEGRILVTADKQLYEKARKLNLEAMFVNIRKSLKEKLKSVVCTKKLKFNPENTRCTKCGGELVTVKDAPAPASVKKLYKEFQKCTSCGHVFWKGSHWEAMKKRVEEVLASCQP